ncbi:MAG TPA: FAD-dependent thymidylate synthase [Caldisericia bacterium]|nr:FAD-dependent thymidylate synthase [Caldisericia bacterium]
MKVELIANTPDPLSLFAQSARITRSKDEQWKSNEYYFKILYLSGHHSVFEHASFSFLIQDISRACSHQLVRFRVGVSFTQRSQRYTEESSFPYTCPPSIQNSTEAHLLFEDFMEKARKTYEQLVDLGIPKEDSRFVLPNATHTSIIMTMNYRELIHSCGLRLCDKSQWEIRALFWRIRSLVQKKEPILAQCLYPRCFHDRLCKESKPCRLKDYYINKSLHWGKEF